MWSSVVSQRLNFGENRKRPTVKDLDWWIDIPLMVIVVEPLSWVHSRRKLPEGVDPFGGIHA